MNHSCHLPWPSQGDTSPPRVCTGVVREPRSPPRTRQPPTLAGHVSEIKSECPAHPGVCREGLPQQESWELGSGHWVLARQGEELWWAPGAWQGRHPHACPLGPVLATKMGLVMARKCLSPPQRGSCDPTSAGGSLRCPLGADLSACSGKFGWSAFPTARGLTSGTAAGPHTHITSLASQVALWPAPQKRRAGVGPPESEECRLEEQVEQQAGAAQAGGERPGPGPHLAEGLHGEAALAMGWLRAGPGVGPWGPQGLAPPSPPASPCG